MTRAIDWLNKNAYRAFPFEEDSSGLCTDGITVPDWLILDAQAMFLSAERNVNPAPHFLELLSFRVFRDPYNPSSNYATTKVKLRMNVLSPSGAPVYCDTYNDSVIPIQIGKPGVASHGMIFFDEGSGHQRMYSADWYYKLVCGAPTSWEDVPDNFYNVEHVLENPRPFLNTRCIFKPGRFGISGFVTKYDSTTPRRYHKVLLKDGHNTTLRIRDGKIVFDISETAGLGSECPDPETTITRSGIGEINGIPAGSDGNFNIYGGAGIKVTSGEYKGIPAIIVSPSGTVDSYVSK